MTLNEEKLFLYLGSEVKAETKEVKRFSSFSRKFRSFLRKQNYFGKKEISSQCR